MQWSLAISSVVLSSLTGLAQPLETHTITSNVRYRISRGGLPQLTFGIEKPKNVKLTQGGEQLLANCLGSKDVWTRDPLLFRLAHTHATEIQSCRENNSPSLHAVFLKVPGKPLETWVHLDGHGAQTSGSRLLHLGEVVFHKVTFQNNDQDRMFENLERSFSVPPQAPRPAPPEFTEHDRLAFFTDKTLTRVLPYATSAFSSVAVLFLSPSPDWGRGTDRFTNHLVGSFTQRLVLNGIQSGVADVLHEDFRYKPSLDNGIWKRSRHAFAGTVLFDTPRGRDIAFSNIVAAIGSGMIIHTYHPGRETLSHTGVWRFASLNLLGFAESNLWNEFKPDIKHLVRSKVLHRR